MLPYLPALVFLGVAVQFVGIGSYIKDMRRGDARPNLITWLLWSIAPLIGAVAAISAGATLEVLPVFMAGFGPLLVLLASSAKEGAHWKLGRFDYGCGALSLLALAFWWVTKIPEVAIFFAIASDGLAALPTLAKSWRHPETERAAPFATGLFGALTGLAAATAWDFSSVAFPLYLILVNAALVLAISRRKTSASGPR